jgi:SAM-dependent methyltransferase
MRLDRGCGWTGAAVDLGLMSPARLEITDLLWPVDSGGARLPVAKAEVLTRLAEAGQRRAVRIVSRMPAANGLLDAGYVDALGLRVHCELQRLSEELQMGRRVAALLHPIVDGLRGSARGEPIRVVDVGCGLGYVVRWLAATSVLGDRVELIGVDLNAALIGQAASLAERESLNCRFVQGDALELGVAVERGDRTVVMSTGLLHHLPESGLPEFFGAHDRLGVTAFAHWDIAPCAFATLGAWLLHQIRMREPVSRHDGVMSARRAHPAPVLQAAAGAGAPGYSVRVIEEAHWRAGAVDVLRPIVGLRGPAWREPEAALRGRAWRRLTLRGRA